MKKPAATATLAVTICTYRRPERLEALLATIIQRAQNEAADHALSIVVVDDCPDRSAHTVVADIELAHAVSIQYHSTASGNVAIARNAAITHGISSDLVVCIDDDCEPQIGWLSELLRVRDVTGADIVTGHHEFAAPAGAASWLTDEPFLDDHGSFPDESDPSSGNMASALISADFLRASGVRFRTDLGVTGGEDMVFFHDARAHGAVVRHAARSIVIEPYDGRRTSLRYQLYRQMWLGNNEIAINRVTNAYPTIRLMLRGGRRVLDGLSMPLRRVLTLQHPRLRWSAAVAVNGVGLLAGACGVRLPHR